MIFLHKLPYQVSPNEYLNNRLNLSLRKDLQCSQVLEGVHTASRLSFAFERREIGSACCTSFELSHSDFLPNRLPTQGLCTCGTRPPPGRGLACTSTRVCSADNLGLFQKLSWGAHFFSRHFHPQDTHGVGAPRPPGHVSALINPPHYGSNTP